MFILYIVIAWLLIGTGVTYRKRSVLNADIQKWADENVQLQAALLSPTYVAVVKALTYSLWALLWPRTVFLKSV